MFIAWGLASGAQRMPAEYTAEGRLAIARAHPTLTDFDGFRRGVDGLVLAYHRMACALIIFAPDGRTVRFIADAKIMSAGLGAGGVVVAGDTADRVLFLRYSAGKER
jgi:hypothetical protein